MHKSNGKGRIGVATGVKKAGWAGLALALLLPVCAAWGTNPATPGVQVVSNETYTLTLTASPDRTAICRGKPVTFTASLRCNDPGQAATNEIVRIDVVSGSGTDVSGYSSVSTSVTGVEQGKDNIEVTAESGDGKGKLSLSRSIDVISVVIESGTTSCVHKANAQLKIDTDQSYSPDDGYGWFVAPEEGLDTSSILGLTFDYSPVSSDPGVYTVTAKSVTLPACQDTCTVHIVKVDLSVAGVDDDVEDVAPGGLVCVTNGPGQTATRTALTINKCDPTGWDGSVELLWTAGNIKVYNAATGGVEVISGTTFANAALPTNLWVEGTAPSAAAGDVVFRLNPVGIDCPNAVEGCDKVVMTAVKVEITHPKEGDIHLKGEEIEFDSKFEPAVMNGVTYAWSVLEGSCDPITVTTEDFRTILKSDGTVKVKLAVTVGGMTCETIRTIEAMLPEVTKLGWKNGQKMKKWPNSEDIVNPVWVKNLNGAVTKKEPGAYIRNEMAKAELSIAATKPLTRLTYVLVKGVGNKENFYTQGAAFRNWNWNSGELVLDSSPLYNSVNFYDTLDVAWYYCVQNLTDGWGEWVEMNESSHVLYTVNATPTASPLYDFGVDKACRYANGAANFAGAINSGFADEIYYDPREETYHDLRIYNKGYGQCCCHAYVFSLLISHVARASG